MSSVACKQNQDEVSPGLAGALYVHVPFCPGKCRYCDFYSVGFDPAAGREYVGAAGEELRSRRGCISPPLRSIFVGGGTPTVLGGRLLGKLLSATREHADDRAEFSVEANPGTVGPDIAGVLRDCGVNRVTLGAQSFRAEELRVLGRRHDGDDVCRAVETLRAADIENIGLDLMYGIPTQTLATWQDSVTRALALRPEHLSCYALSFEPGTDLHQARLGGRVAEMDHAEQEACYRSAIARAADGGLDHYEISNFARPGRRCRHNLTYWHNEPYLGIGPAAASYIASCRRTNLPDLPGYLAAIRAGRRPPCAGERLRGRRAMGETAMLGLRLTEGIERRSFISRHGQDLTEAFPGTITRYRESGALVVTDSHVRIHGEALFVSDSILADILAEAQ